MRTYWYWFQHLSKLSAKSKTSCITTPSNLKIFKKLNLKKYVKKINYFVFITHQVKNHGVSRKWFTETDVKHFLRVVHYKQLQPGVW